MTTHPESSPSIEAERDIFCNRTLNLRAIKAIGFDMDYTLIHYRVDRWEATAYEHLRQELARRGLPVADLRFDPALMIRGLVVDTELGTILKANRFGYVKVAMHGTRPVPWDEQRGAYGRLLVDPSDPRFKPLNTLFSLSEACMYAQLVELADAGGLPRPMSYLELYRLVRSSLDEAHMAGALKDEIMADPDRFVVRDPDLVPALQDMHDAGKRLLLITNSEWQYTDAMMRYALDPFLGGRSWRDLFDIVIVRARKPSFFSERQPLFRIVDESGLLRPSDRGLESGGLFLGGNAMQVEAHLGCDGDRILYVGDHITDDISSSKSVLRWRTALIVRELEDELAAVRAFGPTTGRITALMADKQRLELRSYQLRLAIQRQRCAQPSGKRGAEARLQHELADLRAQLKTLDDKIAPLAQAAGRLHNPTWGLLMRAGNDKSLFASQVELFADIYASRPSNFLAWTPYAFFRSPRGTMPHDEVQPGFESGLGANLDD